jgi:hypothetical protein
MLLAPPPIGPARFWRSPGSVRGAPPRGSGPAAQQRPVPDPGDASFYGPRTYRQMASGDSNLQSGGGPTRPVVQARMVEDFAL